MLHLLTIAMIPWSFGAPERSLPRIVTASAKPDEAVASLRVILPPHPDPVVETIGSVLARAVRSRSSAAIVTGGDAQLAVELSIEPGIGSEGYRIADSADGAVRIIGNDSRGLLYGVGRFLHTSSFGRAGFVPGSWRGVSVPAMPVRGIYLATHFHNYYQVAPIEDVARYVEELSLWGFNSFLVWFGMEEFTGIDDPKARAMLERLRALLGIVKGLGLDASLGCICNDGYKDSPVSLRADDRTVGHEGYHTRMGERIYNLGNELCPSKPGVPELELRYCEEKFQAFKDLGLDYWVITPYDNGGCTCPECAPWGSNGYLRMAELLARAYRRAFPGGKVILGTWYFDRWAHGEWAGLAASFSRRKPEWVDYILADDFGEYPRFPLENGVPGGFPLLNFPEISMWGHDPWGGYGANPYPARLQKRWDQTREKLSGGFPYSEGVYEDLNKVVCARLYWSPERPAIEAVEEYVSFEFSPEVVDDVTRAVTIFEQNHLRDQVAESALEAAELVERAEARLTPEARRSWRWRLVRIRATIDRELHRNREGRGRERVFREACEELVRITRAAEAWPMLRPVPIAAVNFEGPDLGAGYADAVAASRPAAWWRMRGHEGREVEDATGRGNRAACEDGVTVRVPGGAPGAAEGPASRAASFRGGRMQAEVPGLGDAYTVELWLLNALPNAVRPVTGYVFSRGREGPEGTPGDDLGISGTSALDTVPPGRLFFYNGDAAAQLFGKTELAPDVWHHVVLVRDGRRIEVVLDGGPSPEISGEAERGYADGVTRIFVGGRNDGFGSFQGRIAEVSVYDRALSREEIARHHAAAGLGSPGAAEASRPERTPARAERSP